MIKTLADPTGAGSAGEKEVIITGLKKKTSSNHPQSDTEYVGELIYKTFVF